MRLLNAASYYYNIAMIFKAITLDCIEELAPFVKFIPYRSCDYTLGNLVMWARYMNYRYSIEDNTLFISCQSQHDISTKAFFVPIGELPLQESIKRLQDFCDTLDRKLRLTAVPAPYIEEIKALLPTHQIEPLEGWSDYIYSAESLVTLQGRNLNKKRNRFNKFVNEYPSYSYSRLTEEELEEAVVFLGGANDCHDQTIMRCYEQEQCIYTVRNTRYYKQPIGVIRIDGRIVALTLGEICGDTLYIHIEKALREYPGLSECINRCFAKDITEAYPQVTFINREEDLGDPGLRQAKRSYDPLEMLDRYEVIPQ